VKFLIDAQIPRSAADVLKEHGHDAVHTLDLPLQNKTPDADISVCCMEQDRILITKDKDFLNSHIIKNEPAKLVLIKTGNIQNKLLIELLTTHIFLICQLLEQHSLIEIHKHEIVVRREE
jgi:predicted nuclease of predicted toxin-antitoxin system